MIILLGSAVILVFALLGALQAFNTSGVTFLNPDTTGETLAFTGLTVVMFLMLIALLVVLLRNLLKLYADQGSRALCAPARPHGRGSRPHHPHARRVHVPLQSGC